MPRPLKFNHPCRNAVSLFSECLDAEYIHTAENGDYAVEIDGVTLYLYFQCSRGAEDWKNNLDFPAVPYKRMDGVWLCHRGFLRVWKAMRDEIEDRVAGLLSANPYVTGIVCVGYSHGAALAVLATEDMAFLYSDRLTVGGIGFGCPRVLWGLLPQAVKQRLARFVAVRNIPDLVTHLPPAIFGYRHAGKLFGIGERGKYTPVKAHCPEAYTAELKKNAEKQPTENYVRKP